MKEATAAGMEGVEAGVATLDCGEARAAAPDAAVAGAMGAVEAAAVVAPMKPARVVLTARVVSELWQRELMQRSNAF